MIVPPSQTVFLNTTVARGLLLLCCLHCFLPDQAQEPVALPCLVIDQAQDTFPNGVSQHHVARGLLLLCCLHCFLSDQAQEPVALPCLVIDQAQDTLLCPASSQTKPKPIVSLSICSAFFLKVHFGCLFARCTLYFPSNVVPLHRSGGVNASVTPVTDVAKSTTPPPTAKGIKSNTIFVFKSPQFKLEHVNTPQFTTRGCVL